METKSPGGINKVVLEIATILSYKGHNITIIQPNPLNSSAEEELYKGIRIIRVKSLFDNIFYELNPFLLLRLKNYIKDIKPDIVHIHGYLTFFSTSILWALNKTYPNIPIIMSPHFAITSHNTLAGKYLGSFYNKIVGKRIIKYPARIIAASDFESQNLCKLLNVAPEKIIKIPHGVNSIKSNVKKFNKKKIKLLYVGYLIELKGVQYIIQTLHELICNFKKEAVLTIVGEGPFKKDLIKLAEELGVNEHISWKAFVPITRNEELLEYYKKNDFTLLLSSSENFGVVVVESLSVGTPVIVSKRESLNEFLHEQGCFGVDYPPNSNKLAEIIMKIHGSELIVGPFTDKVMTWDEIVTIYEGLYKDIYNNYKKV